MSDNQSIGDRVTVKTEHEIPSAASGQRIFSSSSAFTKYQVRELIYWLLYDRKHLRQTKSRFQLMTLFSPLYHSNAISFSCTQPLTNLQRGNVVQEKSAVTHTRTSFELAAQGEIFADTPMDVSEVTSQGLSLLHVAAMHGQMLTVRCLLSRGADVRARDCRGHSALHYAAFHGHQHVVRELLQLHPKAIDEVDDEGNTALLFACFQKRSHVVHDLLKKGADLSLRNQFEETCYSIAQSINCSEVLSLLEKRIIELIESRFLPE